MKTKNRKKKLKGTYKLTPKKLLKCKTCKDYRGFHRWDCPVLEQENLGLDQYCDETNRYFLKQARKLTPADETAILENQSGVISENSLFYG